MTGAEALALTMIVAFIALVFTGYPIAWILGGLAIVFAGLAIIFEVDFAIPTSVDWFYTSMTVDRIWDVMENWVMVALPMFIFMGVLLDRSGIARSLLTGFARLLGPVRGGLAITVTIIGVLLAASTGIIGASVVLLGLLGLPVMLENRYDKHGEHPQADLAEAARQRNPQRHGTGCALCLVRDDYGEFAATELCLTNQPQGRLTVAAGWIVGRGGAALDRRRTALPRTA